MVLLEIIDVRSINDIIQYINSDFNNLLIINVKTQLLLPYVYITMLTVIDIHLQ